MKMSKRTLTITIIVAAFIVFIGAILLAIISPKLKSHTKIAFYGLSNVQKEALITQMNTIKNATGRSLTYTFNELDATVPLSKQVKGKYDIVFTTLGENAKEATQLVPEKKTAKICMPENTLDGTTISVRQTSLRNADNSISAVPILLDHYEIDIDRSLLKQTGIKTIAAWHDIETFAVAAKKSTNAQIVFAGSDSETYLGIISALTEAFSGKEVYESGVEMIRKYVYERDEKAAPLTGADYDELVKTLSATPDAPFYAAVQMLSRWYRIGLLNSEVFHMTQKDVSAFMDANSASVVFMTLSQHRLISHETIERYSSVYYPSERAASLRFFCAPVIVAIPLTSKKNVSTIINNLVSSDAQDAIGRDSGLAPVQANCRVADHQADDVRYWIAATNAPIVPLGQAAFIDEYNRDLFGERFSNYVHYLK
jgi:hypothetical protein